ncbi:uncharacterized protein LOC111380522 [Olea europaea var. sylvestris]|uniref:uncharacterized protein LOC111380522 n=1 Tax=Olea europaea var. sylvestris TaxID=158386 RepID=UPI000C1D34C7|nr:uncharacterized protein LOC111380522 [Olea europaea var. sylvestris]
MVAAVVLCPKCGKPHRGECLYKKNVYFRCGKSGHIARDCPTFAQRKDYNNDQNKKGKARVFTLTQKDAEGNLNIITGILLVANAPAYIQFDLGAIHSFVSTSFAVKSTITCNKLKSTLEVSFTSGRILNTDKLGKAVKFDIEEKTLEANFYMIDMKDFDMILGMDWLGYNYAIIRCREGEVSFQKPGEEQFSVLEIETKPHFQLVSAL